MPTKSKPAGWDVRIASLRRRLASEGNIEGFEKIVATLRASKVNMYDAVAMAVQYYPIRHKDDPNRIMGYELADPRIGDPELRATIQSVLGDEFLQDLPSSTPQVPADEVQDGDAMPTDPPPKPPRQPRPSPPPPVKPPPAPAGPHPGMVDAGLFNRDPRWADLIRQVPIHQTAPERVIVSWVFNNVLNNIEDIDPKSVPCRGAVAMLIFARSGSSGYSELLAMWQKTLPNQQQLKTDPRFNDDGRTQEKLIEDFLEMQGDASTSGFDEASAEGSGAEPSVPTGDSFSSEG